ncbi:MAG: hypothetical protein ABIY52_08180 [Gemmatimonadaceae bacterium]
MQSPIAPEAALTFWQWFQVHDEELFHLERDMERVFDELAAALKPVHPDLVFEFSAVRDGVREFVISAGGLKDAFPAVAALAASAPDMPRWTVVPFRQPRGLGTVKFGGVEIRGADIIVLPEVNDSLVDIQLFVPGYKSTSQSIFEQIAFLLLDQALGEFAVETSLGSIEIGAPPPVLPSGCISLTDLEVLTRHVAAT